MGELEDFLWVNGGFPHPKEPIQLAKEQGLAVLLWVCWDTNQAQGERMTFQCSFAVNTHFTAELLPKS